MNNQDLTLSPAELKSVTGYAKPIFQLRVLKELGIPARRRPDNTVLVLRMHMLHPSAAVAFVPATPRLKSAKK
jgi:hypothetical protein